MFWPSAQDYNEAIQNPSTSFADEVLRSGKIDTNRLGLPRVMSGAFACVYKVSTDSAPWAVRCFLNCREDQQRRYKAISNFVVFDDLECTVPFYYLEQGIKVKGNWYPLLKMEWVEGITLEKYVEENFRNSKKIVDLLNQFDDMVLDLNRAGIAHGDLQHGNIIVTEHGLRLVDYDALYVPELEGWQSPEIGHPNFQHPARSEKQYNPDVDNFSAWLIHLSLLAISIDPELYRLVEGGDDCILFKRNDYKDPRHSELFKLLVEHPSTELRKAALLLSGMLQVKPDAVPRISASPDDLTRLPDMSQMFLEDISEEEALATQEIREISVLRESGENYANVMPRRLTLKVVENDSEIIVREAISPDSLAQASANLSVKWALFNRNVGNKIRASWDRWYLRRLPTRWCKQRLVKANKLYRKEEYQSAVPVYLELIDVLQLLAENRSFWKSVLKTSMGFTRPIFLYALNFLCIMSITQEPLVRLYLFVVSPIWVYPIDSWIRYLAKKSAEEFNSQRTLIEVQLALGYCFCSIAQWRVASNYFMMAVRNCKWGIDQNLRLRSLLLYALCRNQGGERKEAQRFLMQKQEVIAGLPQLALSDDSLLKHPAAFELFLDLGQDYFKRRLILSAVPPLLAAKSVFASLSESERESLGGPARDMYLMLAYIFTIRSDWYAAQDNFNNMMLLCSIKYGGTAKDLRRAELCAALSSNLKGDLSGATLMLTRYCFEERTILAEICDVHSIAHKIMYYDRSRGIAFFQELAGKLKEAKRFDQLLEICSTLMYMFRSNTTPSPLFPINWLDDLDEDFISECLNRSYFEGREPSVSELNALINAVLGASLTKTMLVLSTTVLKNNMMDTLDHLFNRLAATNQLNKLVLMEGDSTQQKLDRMFVDLILRISAESFKQRLDEQMLDTKAIVGMMKEHGKEKLRSITDIIYGAYDVPALVEEEYLRYRGILRFVELSLAKQLASENLSEESLLLYDRLEGYYSTNIDRVLDTAIANVCENSRRDANWLRNVVGTSDLAYQYRGGESSEHLEQLRQHVKLLTSKKCCSKAQLESWREIVTTVDGYDRASFSILDTICDTVALELEKLSEASTKKSFSQNKRDLLDALAEFSIALAYVYEIHEGSRPALQALRRVHKSVDSFSPGTARRYKLAYAIALKVEMETEATEVLTSVVDVKNLRLDLSATDQFVYKLAHHAESDFVDLLINAGDVTRIKKDEDAQSRSRCFYVIAAQMFNSLSLPQTTERSLSAKLVDRLGQNPRSEEVINEIECLDDTSDSSGSVRGNYL